MAERILMNEFKTLSQEKWVNIDVSPAPPPSFPCEFGLSFVSQLVDESIKTWSIALMVLNPDSLYYGGYFKATMTFPDNYPYSPPTFQFAHPLFHPNIYQDGKLCISILHQPGEDEQSGEVAAERWSPVQRVESVLLSIISLLDDAECSSPANVDAGVLLRKDHDAYKKKVKADVEKSREDVPKGFVMPTHESTVKKPIADLHEHDEDFWNDSGDDEDEFGGSDTDEEMGYDDGEDQEDDDED